jgi:hypothetical protein
MNWSEDQLREHYSRLKGGDAKRSPSCTATADSPEAPITSAVRSETHAPPKSPGGAHIPNKWETAYAREELEPGRLAGEIVWYGFEAIKLRLADCTFYTPDFAVLRWPPQVGSTPRLEFVEIKGFIRDDAILKFKVAAAQFPFRFTMIRKRKVKDGGRWEVIRDLNA